MKLRWLSLAALSVSTLDLTTDSAAAQEAAQEVVKYTVRRASAPIAIDGRLDEPDWKAAPGMGAFQFPWWQSGKREQTAAKLLWDEKNLYVSYRCEDAHISAERTERDSDVYRDDCVEVFIAPNPDKPMHYFNIEMNVIGAFLDQHHPDGPGKVTHRNWNAKGVTIKTTIDGTLNDDGDTDKGWTLEAAIPLANYAAAARHTPPRAGDIWHLNLNRLGGKTNPQFSQWSPGKTKQPQFHAPKYFGRVIFAK